MKCFQEIFGRTLLSLTLTERILKWPERHL